MGASKYPRTVFAAFVDEECKKRNISNKKLAELMKIPEQNLKNYKFNKYDNDVEDALIGLVTLALSEYDKKNGGGENTKDQPR